jgi:hypothetical protein
VNRIGAVLLLALTVATSGGCREQTAPGAVRGPALEGGPAGGDAGLDAAGGQSAADGPPAEMAVLTPGVDGPDGGAAGGDLGADAAAPPPDEALVGWWRFDDLGGHPLVRDSSGRSNQGTAMDVAASAAIAGRQGGALDLSGAGAHVRVPSSVSINGVFRAFTMAAFVRQQATRAERATVLARQGGYALGLTAGRPFVALTLEGGEVPVELAAATTAATQRWVHVAATFDGEVARLFLDGKEAASLAVVGTIGNSNVPLTIGARMQGTMVADPLGGALDEVRLYARALTAAELAAVANAD